MSPQGKLVLVVGPSGAGKDSLIQTARQMLEEQALFVFPPRTITRPPDPSEANRYLTEEAFAAAKQAAQFVLTWRAHGCHYGIDRAVLADVATGHIVIINVSRSVVAEARALGVSVVVSVITADPDIRAARIAHRGREQVSEGRVHNVAPDVQDLRPDIIVTNNSTLQDAAQIFVGFLQGLIGPS